MNGYRFDVVIETDAEMSDDLLCELSLEMRATFLSFLKAKRVKYTQMVGDIDVSKAKSTEKNKDNAWFYTTFTGNYKL